MDVLFGGRCEILDRMNGEELTANVTFELRPK